MKEFEASFLKGKYWNKEAFREAVEKSAQKKQRMTEDEAFRISQHPREKIPYYLERIERATGKTDPKTGERGRLFLETSLYPEYIIKPEHISDEYIKSVLLGNFAEQRGYERDDLKKEEIKKRVLEQFKQETEHDFYAYAVPDEERENVRAMVVKDQTARLTAWYDYLTGPEARRNVSAAFRYWAFAEMLKLGDYDAVRKKFNKRTETTAASFPELDQQALSDVFDAIERKLTTRPQAFRFEDEASKAAFRKLLENENFGDLYTFALERVNTLRLPTERLAVVDGEWKRFPKNSSARELTKTIEGFQTKWCIAGDGYAQGYLSHSDVWIYYSQDVGGRNSIPRACIVDSGEHGITEVRGIIFTEDAKQHLDDYITPIVEKKLNDMPGGAKWQETMQDMKRLAGIHLKSLQKEPLIKEDITFLYEMDRPIRSSGYQKDPRIAELRAGRNTEEDMLIVFECAKDQIAHSMSEINENTKAYVGPLAPGIFQKLPDNLEHVYTAFPERKIRREHIKIGGKTAEQLIREMRAAGIKISPYAESMLTNMREFTAGAVPEDATLIRLTVDDLGFIRNATTAQIYERAQALGLELCPTDTGPQYRLQYQNQPLGEWFYIGMKQIVASDGDPCVFDLGRRGGGLWLGRGWAKPGNEWFPDRSFVFRLRKSLESSASF